MVLGVQGCRAARACGRDRLAVGVVDQVPGREHPGDVGRRAAALDLDVALLVEVDDALDELVAWVVTDGDEDAGGGQEAGRAGERVTQGHPGDLVLAVDLLHRAVPGEGDLGVGHRTGGHDLGGA